MREKRRGVSSSEAENLLDTNSGTSRLTTWNEICAETHCPSKSAKCGGGGLCSGRGVGAWHRRIERDEKKNPRRVAIIKKPTINRARTQLVSQNGTVLGLRTQEKEVAG